MALVRPNQTVSAPIAAPAPEAAPWDDAEFQEPAPVYAPQPAPVQAVVPTTVPPASLPQRAAQVRTDDLHLDFLSFPTIKIENGRFAAGQKSFPPGAGFRCQVAADKRTCYIIRAAVPGQRPDPKQDIRFTYDRVTATNGDLLEDFIALKKAEGKQITEGQQYEVPVFMLDGEFAGQPCILQIPSRSMSRYDGSVFTARFKYGSEYGATFLCEVDEPVRANGNSFNPWKITAL